LRIAFGEMSRLLLTGQRVFPVRAEAAGFEFEFRDLESALRDALADRAPA
jgi:NAD dependent epimerase/dehydratase family enzyme